MTTQTSSIGSLNKPIPLRIIFILNAIMMVLPFVFYFVITSNNISIGDLDPNLMLYTGMGYIVSFGLLVFFILSRKLWGVQAVIGLNVLIALPAKAYIGILVALISFGLSFHKKVKAYFHA